MSPEPGPIFRRALERVTPDELIEITKLCGRCRRFYTVRVEPEWAPVVRRNPGPCPRCLTEEEGEMGVAQRTESAPHTVAAMAPRVGEAAMLRTEDGLHVPVTVVDAKYVWGALRLKVEPVGGAGRVWVDSRRVEGTP